MTEPKKELPSSEYSLKSISWHLKTLVEEIKKLNESLVKVLGGNKDFF
jgi:hypothetical protein